jgi:FlaA1/EpsC-like NDP-sugar epimerase
MSVSQLLIFLVCGLAAFQLRFEFSLPPGELAHLAWAVPVWLVVKSLVFWAFKLDRGTWKFASVPDMTRVLGANLAGSALSVIAIVFLAPRGFPRSVWVLDLMLCAQATAGIRLLVRMCRGFVMQSEALGSAKRVLIYGAGCAGVMLLQEIRQNPKLAYDVRGFLDDNPGTAGKLVQSVWVLGTGADLPAIAAREAIGEVLLAIPSASGAQMTRILQHCREAHVRFKTVPGIGELIAGPGLAKQIREVAVEDLLGRKPVRLDETAIRSKLQGAVVAVTGAAGSIGSELCRQVARFGARAIVAYETAETPLFELQQEMLQRFPMVPFHAEIGNILDGQRLSEVFERRRPSILYHAAAYKHVPMMESALFCAAENNILGTYKVAVAAIQHGVADFVMISSDKAVRPTSIMGVTKRVAEQLVGSMQNGTKCVSVRFGNVLGSSGSVVPIFKRQIAAGGPVTVTDPAMRRFFMTIPEAVQLVLQASTMSGGGEIFVLNMGEPVRIADLARNLILLSGLQPEEDIRIEYTGVRPGEKLYEEIHAEQENTLPTYHEKINIFAGPVLSRREMERHIEIIRRLCRKRDAARLVLELKHLVPEYNPSSHVLERLLDVEAPGMDPIPEYARAQAQ